MTNIIDNLKGKAFQAFCLSERYLDELDDRECALVAYGRGCGILQALDELVGTHADTSNLVKMRIRIEEKTDYAARWRVTV